MKIKNHALRIFVAYDIIITSVLGGDIMTAADIIRKLREQTGLTRKDFSLHTGIPIRTLEDWEAGRRTPPEYIPRLIEYQIKYEELTKKMNQGVNIDDTKK